jgi:hypothetical protein
MSRRGDPERIFDAQRQGVRARLTGTDRIQPETADRWLEAWVLEAATRDLAKDGVYWNAGFDLGHRGARPDGGPAERDPRDHRRGDEMLGGPTATNEQATPALGTVSAERQIGAAAMSRNGTRGNAPGVSGVANAGRHVIVSDPTWPGH